MIKSKTMTKQSGAGRGGAWGARRRLVCRLPPSLEKVREQLAQVYGRRQVRIHSQGRARVRPSGRNDKFHRADLRKRPDEDQQGAWVPRLACPTLPRVPSQLL